MKSSKCLTAFMKYAHQKIFSGDNLIQIDERISDKSCVPVFCEKILWNILHAFNSSFEIYTAEDIFLKVWYKHLHHESLSTVNIIAVITFMKYAH